MKFFSEIEWPTVALLVITYCLWAAALLWASDNSVWLAILLAAVAIAQHGSLQHEAIHCHPSKSTALNTALVWPPLTLVIPYLRFRDTHLDHHQDADLTDPYDDPETNFMMPAAWQSLSRVSQAVLVFNNTLFGRLLIGPMIGTLWFLRSDWAKRRADRRIVVGWLWHVPAACAVLGIVIASPLPVWAYLVAVYVSLALLRIRTFLEHQAHDHATHRSVIVEDCGPLALLFLNNNYHAVHHAHPGLAWYRLPAFYRAHSDRFLKMNGGYRFRSYAQVFAQYMFHQKDPVAHPLRSDEG